MLSNLHLALKNPTNALKSRTINRGDYVRLKNVPGALIVQDKHIVLVPGYQTERIVIRVKWERFAEYRSRDVIDTMRPPVTASVVTSSSTAEDLELSIEGHIFESTLLFHSTFRSEDGKTYI